MGTNGFYLFYFFKGNDLALPTKNNILLSMGSLYTTITRSQKIKFTDIHTTNSQSGRVLTFYTVQLYSVHTCHVHLVSTRQVHVCMELYIYAHVYHSYHTDLYNFRSPPCVHFNDRWWGPPMVTYITCTICVPHIDIHVLFDIYLFIHILHGLKYA